MSTFYWTHEVGVLCIEACPVLLTVTAISEWLLHENTVLEEYRRMLSFRGKIFSKEWPNPLFSRLQRFLGLLQKRDFKTFSNFFFISNQSFVPLITQRKAHIHISLHSRCLPNCFLRPSHFSTLLYIKLMKEKSGCLNILQGNTLWNAIETLYFEFLPRN